MTDEEAAFEMIALRRNVGATLKQVHENVMYRTKVRKEKRAREILEALEADGELVTVGDKWFLTSSGYKRAKGSAVPAVWEDADAWLLLSALRCSPSKQSDISDLIASADYINHAIPSHEEIHGAINRLRSGRLITTKRGKLRVTPRAEELMKKVEATCKRAVLSQLDGVRRLLDCPCCGVELKRVRWGYELDAEAYEASVKAYVESFARS
jgi:hypothetical protein